MTYNACEISITEVVNGWSIILTPKYANRDYVQYVAKTKEERDTIIMDLMSKWLQKISSSTKEGN